ncbi:MAG: bifunctional folylpolyglutamate synthase/dihydrofolate synthase [Alphaproteobacteria bacterium]|nr:bifunctional folylpolyglutamate synthase/dihydrofolate synthase [Alphaproteobacteria bacterium]
MRLHPKKIDLSLGRMEKLLAALGNPEKKLPPVIHIAGTNGKGSTTATLRAIAEAAGHRVHVYTSPHLVRFAERIRLAGKLISEDDLTALLEECEEAAGEDPITFFEVTTAAALLAFSRTPADLCIMEVGLGGRLDATNVVAKPAAVGITPVSMDHEQFLGDTLAAIAGEKAGIIKEGVPAVIGPQMGDAAKVIMGVCEEKGVQPKMFERDWQSVIKPKGDGFQYGDWCSELDLPMPNLVGEHQVTNAGMAIALAHAQKAVSIPDAAIRAGLGWVRWPARLQEIKNSPLNAMLPEGHSLWLDGGHNPAAGHVVRTFLAEVNPVEREIILILGMLGNKDAAGYLKPLSGIVNRVIAVPIPGEESAAEPGFLAGAATDAGINGIVAKDVSAALKLTAEKAQDERPPFVLIGGSLYLAGQVLRAAEIMPG